MHQPGLESGRPPAAEEADRTNVRAARSMPPVGVGPDGSRIGALVAAEAEGWIGTPFQWQASLKGVGADCKGLIAGVARALALAEGASLEAFAADYGAVVPAARLRAGLARLFDRADAILPGDVLLLKVGGKAQHLAIAAPIEGQPSRTIQALHNGPRQVVAVRQPRDTIDSIWRWKE